jgi:hypothetical protein
MARSGRRPVLAEADGRIAYRPHDATGQVGQPAERIEESTVGRRVRHGVDRDITAGQVLLDRADELHLVGMPRVRVADVGAIGRHLDGLPVHDRRDGPVPEAGRLGVRQERHHPLGRGIGGDVGVAGRAAEEDVANGAADEEGFVAVGGQGVQNGDGGRPGAGVGGGQSVRGGFGADDVEGHDRRC